MDARTITMLAQWAANANTVIAAPPVPGQAYRNTALSVSTVQTGQRYSLIADSAEWNQLHWMTTGLVQQLEQYGILPYSALTNYPVSGICMGLDGLLYQALLASGPGTPVGPQPTTNATYWATLVDSEFDPAPLGTYTAKTIITSSRTWTTPRTGWYRVTCIGGGGGGGAAGWSYGAVGGNAGGQTSYTPANGTAQVAAGGSGGGGGGGQYCGGGGGGSGFVNWTYRSHAAGVSISIVVGAGGAGGNALVGSGALWGGKGQGPQGGAGSYNDYNSGWGGGPNGESGGFTNMARAANGGKGGATLLGYGGGGGGGGFIEPATYPNIVGGGFANDGGGAGTSQQGIGSGWSRGGNGGAGAVIIEYQGAI